MNTTKIIIIALSINLFSCGNTQQNSNTNHAVVEKSINHPTLQIFELDGRLLRMNSFVGKPYVIIFWNTQNTQSIEALKTLENIKKELGEDLIVLALSEEPAFKQIQYKNKNKHPFYFYKAKFPQEVTTLPALQLYNKEHKLVKELTQVDKQEIEKLLHE